MPGHEQDLPPPPASPAGPAPGGSGDPPRRQLAGSLAGRPAGAVLSRRLRQITKEGNDLLWNGETWKQIFNLIKLVDPEKYTSNEIRRITNKSIMETIKGIEYLRKERNLIEGESKGFKLYFVLSEKGRSYSDENNQKTG